MKQFNETKDEKIILHRKPLAIFQNTFFTFWSELFIIFIKVLFVAHN